MKLTLTALLLSIIMCKPLYAGGTLEKVEPLTHEEKNLLYAARQGVTEAKTELRKLEERIARDHKMKEESWMEWRSWFEIDGDYILLRAELLMDRVEGE
jgi:hypothetical protein